MAPRWTTDLDIILPVPQGFCAILTGVNFIYLDEDGCAISIAAPLEVFWDCREYQSNSMLTSFWADHLAPGDAFGVTHTFPGKLLPLNRFRFHCNRPLGANEEFRIICYWLPVPCDAPCCAIGGPA